MKHDFFTIKGFSASAFAEVTNPDGRVKVEMPAGSSGLTDVELRASSVPIMQVSGSQWSTLARPVNVRGSLATAYAQVTTGTETQLLAAQPGYYADLIYIMGANNSDVAVSVDIRSVPTGNVLMTLQIPAKGTAGISCPVPLPAADTGNDWTADMDDITGTTVSLTALFSKEI